MIIGIDASRANRDHRSGTEWYAYYLIKELALLDSHNQYILYTDQPLGPDLVNLCYEDDSLNAAQATPNNQARGSWQTIASPHHNFKAKHLHWPFKFLWTQGRLSLEMLWHRPDVLFVPAHTLPLIHPRRSVMTIHDIGFKESAQMYSQELIMPRQGLSKRLINCLIRLGSRGKYQGSQLDYLHWSTQYGLKRAKKIITISNFSKQELLKHYQVKSDKITVVHNGYNNRLYQRLTDEEKMKKVLAKYGIEQPFLFYVGRLEKKKNTDKLIEAFALCKQRCPDLCHRLCLAGDASFGFDEIKYQINEFNLADDVIMPGWVEESDLPHIYNAAAAFVFPSNYEGFGIPLLQAMACGAPIVASQTASIPEIVQDAAWLFDPHDVSDMADKIAKVLTDQAGREQLIAKGLERVKNFSWQKCAQETLAVLEAASSRR